MFRYTVGEGLKTVSAVSYVYDLNGEVELPSLTIIGSPRFIDVGFSISSAKIVAKAAGTAQVKVVLKSFDSTGADEVTHIDDTLSLTSKTLSDLTVSIAAVGSNRQFELSVQTLTGTPSEDITITIL
jgi:hypothetical protein